MGYHFYYWTGRDGIREEILGKRGVWEAGHTLVHPPLEFSLGNAQETSL